MGVTEDKIKRMKEKYLAWCAAQGIGIGHQHEWVPAEKKDGSGKTIYGFKCLCRQTRYTDYR